MILEVGELMIKIIISVVSELNDKSNDVSSLWVKC